MAKAGYADRERSAASVARQCCTILLLFSVVACSSAGTVAPASRANLAQPMAIVSPEFRDAVTRLDSPEYAELLKSIQNTGDLVSETDFPWQMGLQIGNSSQRCGAILISARYVLTAAHCVDRHGAKSARKEAYPVSQVRLFTASKDFGSKSVDVDGSWPIRMHESYKSGGRPYSFDAALLRLAHPLAGSTPAPIARQPFASGPAVTSGWGNHPSDGTGKLRAETVPVVETATCRKEVGPDVADWLDGSTICTLDRAADSCGRDSGGPLVIGTRAQPQTIGIVSWGYTRACGMPVNELLVGVYARGSLIADWVVSTTGDAATVTNLPAATPLMSVNPLPDS